MLIFQTTISPKPTQAGDVKHWINFGQPYKKP